MAAGRIPHQRWRFRATYKNEMKCLKYSKSSLNEDSEKVTTKVAQRQLCYMPLTHRMKRLFLSKKIVRHMRWHKKGVRENDQVMVHPSDTEAWKALDDFDAYFTRDARNVCIGLAMDGFTPYNTSAALYSC
jgi:superfamily I DNA/RNA helicase